jgi:serine/threonine protein kinase
VQVLVREALVWSQLRHPRVLPFIGIENNSSQSPHTIGLVSHYMTNGNLRDWIAQNRESYDTKVEGYNLVREL